MTYSELAARLARGDVLKSNKLTETFGWREYQALHGPGAILYFALDKHGHTHVFHPDARLKPEAGWTLIALIDAEQDQTASKTEPRHPPLP